MIELYETAFSAVNTPYTLLLILVVVYWMLVIVGLVNIDVFDFDLDADVGIDGDLDADIGDISGAGGFSMLGFLNLGEVPIMFYVSIVSLLMWVTSIRVNELFNPEGNAWFAAALAVPNFVAALTITKFLLEPIKYYKRHRPPTSTLVGKVCVVKSLEVTEEFGRCEVANDSAPIIVNARTENGEVLKQGDAALIVKALSGGFHLVTKHDWE
ncbi:MAG: hypothetical protein VB876_13070 [Pirellulales bacterium]